MANGEISVGILTGSSDILCHTERIAGFSSTLAPYADHIHIISITETHDDEIESYEKTTKMHCILRQAAYTADAAQCPL